MKTHQKYAETSIYLNLKKIVRFVYEEFINAPSERRSFLMTRLNDFVTESIKTFANVYEEKYDLQKKIKGIEHLSNLLQSIQMEINVLTDLKLIPDTHAMRISDEALIPLELQYEKYSTYTVKNMNDNLRANNG